ncbi:hypothetical protein I350_02503 [Cryptococcus amylolentus CBS 6273]|uniref:RRM domain-containing protein n=1 Tax=Cryptococcus amylolentus CBS 6273 TaxID=1296118 RepID=A0A1E3KAX7_9TREE|nr:hypothetical protein I350_02503 [Cryptococcus amylolentus CBS 6273]
MTYPETTTHPENQSPSPPTPTSDSRAIRCSFEENERLKSRVRDLEEELGVLKWEQWKMQEEQVEGDMGSGQWTGGGEGSDWTDGGTRGEDVAAALDPGKDRKRQASDSRDDSSKKNATKRSSVFFENSPYLPTPASRVSGPAREANTRLYNANGLGVELTLGKFWETFGLDVQAPTEHLRPERSSSDKTSVLYRSNYKKSDTDVNGAARDNCHTWLKTIADEDTKATLIIHDLPYDFTYPDLVDLFGTFGFTIRSSSVLPAEFGKSKARQTTSRGFCFVRLKDGKERDRALKKMHGMKLDRKKVKVQVAKPAKYTAKRDRVVR